MTTKELFEKYVNHEFQVKTDIGLVDCTILDAKQSYGNIRFLVSPIMGSGSAWVDISRLQGVDTFTS